MSEELLASLIRERHRDMQDRFTVLDKCEVLYKKLKMPTKPVSYDEAIALDGLRDDWAREYEELNILEKAIYDDIAATEKAIGDIIPMGIPILIEVDGVEWTVETFSGGGVEVRAHGHKQVRHGE